MVKFLNEDGCQFTDLESVELSDRVLERFLLTIEILLININYYIRNLNFLDFLILILNTLQIRSIVSIINRKYNSGRIRKKRVKNKPVVLNLKAGDIVEVLSEDEILPTLNHKGTYQRLGFMPEIRKFCGKKYRVLKRVDRMMVEGKGMRRLKNTVFLEGVFCDGESQGACQRTCYIAWREGWLRKVDKL